MSSAHEVRSFRVGQADYLTQVKKVSRVGKVGKPLVVFDLDGTVRSKLSFGKPLEFLL